MRTRTSDFTRQPSAEHIRRIWRFGPCVSTMRNDVFPARVTTQGFVFSPPMRTPAAIIEKKSAGHGRLDRHQVFLLVPVLDTEDLVDDVAVVGEEYQALESLSSRPIGKIRSRCPTKSTTLPSTSRSVVQVIPRGLLSAM